MAENDIIPEKRTKMSCDNELFSESHTSFHNDVESEDEDYGPVRQLVGMFSALVAQGDKAAKSLEILISSISSDLLAEVVIANIRQLPSSCPKIDGEEEHLSSNDASVIAKAFPLLSSLLKVPPAISNVNNKINEVGITGMEDDIIRMEEDIVKDLPTVPDAFPEPVDQPRQENNDSSAQVIDTKAQTVSEGSAHKSVGPKMDIVVEEVGCRTGFVASNVEEYAEAILKVLYMLEAERHAIAASARKRAQRFSEQKFYDDFIVAIHHLIT